jgi:ectoine hydroxylase-related dioxygenase (phytanoyl-CoA dioxygenase family)
MGERNRRLDELEQHGYTIIEGVLDPTTVETLRAELEHLYTRLAEVTGKPWGPERGLENLTNKSRLFLDAIEKARPVIELMEAILGPNLVLASLNARSSSAYTPAQGLHRDHQGQLWYERRADGRYVTAHVYMQSLWVLDDMTPDRGATRIVPGTHTAEAGDPRSGSPFGEPISLVAPAGAVAVFPASLWHAGGEHTGPGVRRVFHGFFSRCWAMPQFDNLRSAPRELLSQCTPFQRQLLGYDRQPAWEESWGNWRRAEIPDAPPKGVWEQ